MAKSRVPRHRAAQLLDRSLMSRFTPQHWRTLEAVFVAAGFQFAGQKGSHRTYVKPGIARPLVIPAYRDVPVFIIRNNLKTAGLSRDEYFELLGQVG
jgi:predicted RNA binding protein YcfA (HicA-like mRNA interferase family)